MKPANGYSRSSRAGWTRAAPAPQRPLLPVTLPVDLGCFAPVRPGFVDRQGDGTTVSPVAWGAVAPWCRCVRNAPGSGVGRRHGRARWRGVRGGCRGDRGSRVPVTGHIERVNKEIKRRTNVVDIFPDEAGVLRLAGSIRIEVHNEWQVTEPRAVTGVRGCDVGVAGRWHAGYGRGEEPGARQAIERQAAHGNSGRQTDAGDGRRGASDRRGGRHHGVTERPPRAFAVVALSPCGDAEPGPM